jgi:hypothetical protein
MPLSTGNPKVRVPLIPFEKSGKGRGVVGPYGEVLIFKVGNEELPVFVTAADGSATMDITGRSAFIRYGIGSTAITLTTDGVKFGAAKLQPWTAVVVRRLIGTLAKDRKKAQGVMLLRSALHTSYPIAVAQSKSLMGKRMGASMAKGATGFGRGAMNCVTKTVTDIVVRTVTDVIQVVKDAEKQYQECYDREIVKDPCKSAGLMAGACAAVICAATEFVDLVVGFVEVVTTVAEEVTRKVVACTIPKVGEWPNPWTISAGEITAAIPQPKAPFGKKELDDALKLLKNFGDVLGPFGKCLLEGNWSLAQLDTRLDLNGDLVIPYGVKVCISADCASKLAIDQVFFQHYNAWTSALVVLAALSPEFAALVASFGITAAPAVAAAVASLVPAVVKAAAIIFAFVLLALIYATAISAQLSFHRSFTNNFADGKVCIEHPTFALALIKLASFTLVPSELVPPIVTG